MLTGYPDSCIVVLNRLNFQSIRVSARVLFFYYSIFTAEQSIQKPHEIAFADHWRQLSPTRHGLTYLNPIQQPYWPNMAGSSI